MSVEIDDLGIDEWVERTDVRMNAALIATKIEADLLAAIDHLDHDTRTVYADYLEQMGEVLRAEFVRLQDQLVTLDGDERDNVLFRCREIADDTDMAWRVLVSRPAIQNCFRFAGCPSDWGSLAPTGRPEVRYCETCGECVHYCADDRDLEQRDQAVDRFVLDLVNLMPERLADAPPEDPIEQSVAGEPFYNDPEGPDGGTMFDDSVQPWHPAGGRR